MTKKVFLLILDGFGIREETEYNAIRTAKIPNIDRIFSNNPFTTIHASNGAVGLPKGYIGSSEVGHMNIGSGRIVLQSFAKINQAIEKHTLKENKELKKAIENAKKNNRIHLMGLLSDAGVHSHIEHLFALLSIIKEEGITNAYIHAFLDGRDVEPKSALRYIEKTKDYCEELGIGEIVSLHGRFYAMDRDNRWDRVKKTYDCITQGIGEKVKTAEEGIREAYERGETDEFVKPTIISKEGIIKEGDTIIHFNFREDRARELTKAIVEENFEGFERKKISTYFLAMTQYYKELKTPIMYPFEKIKNTIGEYISKKGMKQLRIAETEKYAHVTYFFSGGEEKPFPGEERILIPSNKEVKTYDQAPEMRTREIAEKAIKFVKEKHPELVVCNIAAPDMVGHTGVFEAAVKAIEVVDEAVGKIEECCKKEDYCLIITADHGNCEEMTGKYKTSHTLNPVPFCIINYDDEGRKINYELEEKEKGVLGDIAVTILKIMGLEKPNEMSRQGLIK